MDIKEMSVAKEFLRLKIQNDIQSFQDSTGVFVTDVNYCRHEVLDNTAMKVIACSPEIHITVELE